MSMEQVIEKVLVFIVIAALVPVGLLSYFAANTSGWDASTLAMWGILAIFFIIGLVMYLVPRSKNGGTGR